MGKANYSSLELNTVNIQVANWYYKWDVLAIYLYEIIDFTQLSAFCIVTQSLAKRLSR
jgi:hypothetical protein